MSVMANHAFCFLFDLLVLISREVVSPLPGITIKLFDSEGVTSLFSIESILEDMYKIMYYSALLIYLCFLTFFLLQLVMFTGVNLSSNNVLQEEQP